MFITLFEDDLILAIDKPSGLPSNSLAHSTMSCEALLKTERASESFFLLHRLDTGTSGVLLFAKKESVFNEMREQFKLKKVTKNYLAWTAKKSSQDAAFRSLRFPHVIDTPLAHHAKSKKRMIVIPEGSHRHMRGKPIPAKSIIHASREESFLGVDATVLEIKIETGVMHQIRVHLASMNLPLIGDKIYGAPNATERLGLHAYQICFGLGGFQYKIESPWPSKTPIWSA